MVGIVCWGEKEFFMGVGGVRIVEGNLRVYCGKGME